MSSDFDKALRAADAQQQAAAHEKVVKEQEAKRLQQIARSVAEPYLASLGQEVREQLVSLRVPLVRRRDPSPMGLLRPRRAFWPIDLDALNGWHQVVSGKLCLTGDGYFLMDYRLSGREGFEAMMSRVRMADASESSTFNEPHRDEVFVDSKTRAVCICKAATAYDEFRLESHEISAFIAETVLWFRNGKVDLRKFRASE